MSFQTRVTWCPRSSNLGQVCYPNYASNNTIDAEGPRFAGCNPLTRPRERLSSVHPSPHGRRAGVWTFFTRIQTNQRALPIEKQRMEMSTKRLFHYKQEMRAFDW